MSASISSSFPSCHFLFYHFSYLGISLSLFFVRELDCIRTVLGWWQEGTQLYIPGCFLQMMKVDDSFFVTTFPKSYSSSVSLITSKLWYYCMHCSNLREETLVPLIQCD
jgi:hypothetical protein